MNARQVTEEIVPPPRSQTTPADLLCDYENCPRHLIPFDTIKQRKSHRFAAHGVRTERLDSIARRERRVRAGILEELTDDLDSRSDIDQRQANAMLGVVGAVLAKRGILIAPQQVEVPPPPHPTMRPRFAPERQGALPTDEVETVRRRMLHTVTVLSVELQRFPSDVLNAVSDVCGRRLYPRKMYAVQLDPDNGYAIGDSAKRGRRNPVERSR